MNKPGTDVRKIRPKTLKLATSLFLFIIPLLHLRVYAASLVEPAPRLAFLVVCSLFGPVLGIISISCIRKDKGLVPKIIIIYITVLSLITSGYIVAAKSFGHENCEENLRVVSKAVWAYVENNGGKFPTADKWCSLLVQNTDLQRGRFICKSAKWGMSNYAINPNATPASPRNMILLFETKGGWNQAGGPELLTTDNHDGAGGNVMFVNGYVGFVEARWIDALKWKIEDYNKSREQSRIE
ncbi:MAG: hypothetical protein ACYSWP_13855 [Planctomycetota bacterium]|jgi:hypothetical protein